MKLNKNLILIGMMASGKSTIGNLLAKKLNLKFFDTDFIIEKKTNMKIFEIFERKGEATFRNLEKKVALSLLNKKSCIISLGGGAFLNKKIRETAEKKGVTIWLKCKSKTIINRIKKNNKRPLALNLSDNEIKDLLINRSKIYSKAKYEIDCENMEKAQIVNKITQILKL
jgi:shikimate kinase